jgi:hypothetical protein
VVKDFNHGLGVTIETQWHHLLQTARSWGRYLSEIGLGNQTLMLDIQPPFRFTHSKSQKNHDLVSCGSSVVVWISDQFETSLHCASRRKKGGGKQAKTPLSPAQYPHNLPKFAIEKCGTWSELLIRLFAIVTRRRFTIMTMPIVLKQND